MLKKFRGHRLGRLVFLLLLVAATSQAQSSSFTYQGRLTDGGTAANGNYDLQFALFDSLSGGAQIGSTQTLNTVAVSNGAFTVSLDFGASSFNGANRFLEISAWPSGSGSFTLLSPRQRISSTPYAIRSLNATSADTVTVNGVPAGSGNYIQNTTSEQPASNFHVSGNGAAGGTLSATVIDASTQYNRDGNRILSNDGTNNLFVGVGTGPANTGLDNSFVGSQAGLSNVDGNANSFFGSGAGKSNINGAGDSFFGSSAGVKNSTAVANTFLGSSAGSSNTNGSSNTFVGNATGMNNINGAGNTFIGSSTGLANVSGIQNTMIGTGATLGSDGILNSTAIGHNARVDASNSLVLGSIKNVNGATADTNVGIGTTTPSNRLEVNLGSSTLNDPGITIQGQTSSLGDIGIRIKNTNGGNEWYIDSTGTGSNYGAGRLAFAIRGSGTPALALTPNGTLAIPSLGAASSTQATLCRNTSSEIAFCNSSSLRYKTNVATFYAGMNIISRLRPISFTWKQDGVKDIGFGAEEVEKVAPIFTFRNDKGQIEGVRYDRLGVVFVNAFIEQQAQIQKQAARIEQQQLQLKDQHIEAKQQEAEIAQLNARLQAVERALRKRPSRLRGR
jgi:Chaperone of endosialidase